MCYMLCWISRGGAPQSGVGRLVSLVSFNARNCRKALVQCKMYVLHTIQWPRAHVGQLLSPKLSRRAAWAATCYNRWFASRVVLDSTSLHWRLLSPKPHATCVQTCHCQDISRRLLHSIYMTAESHLPRPSDHANLRNQDANKPLIRRSCLDDRAMKKTTLGVWASIGSSETNLLIMELLIIGFTLPHSYIDTIETYKVLIRCI
jgi:hypothetical protein